jgi:hypothetical protein
VRRVRDPIWFGGDDRSRAHEPVLCLACTATLVAKPPRDLPLTLFCVPFWPDSVIWISNNALKTRAHTSLWAHCQARVYTVNQFSAAADPKFAGPMMLNAMLAAAPIRGITVAILPRRPSGRKGGPNPTRFRGAHDP